MHLAPNIETIVVSMFNKKLFAPKHKNGNKARRKFMQRSRRTLNSVNHFILARGIQGLTAAAEMEQSGWDATVVY